MNQQSVGDCEWWARDFRVLFGIDHQIIRTVQILRWNWLSDSLLWPGISDELCVIGEADSVIVFHGAREWVIDLGTASGQYVIDPIRTPSLGRGWEDDWWTRFTCDTEWSTRRAGQLVECVGSWIGNCLGWRGTQVAIVNSSRSTYWFNCLFPTPQRAVHSSMVN